MRFTLLGRNNFCCKFSPSVPIIFLTIYLKCLFHRAFIGEGVGKEQSFAMSMYCLALTPLLGGSCASSSFAVALYCTIFLFRFFLVFLVPPLNFYFSVRLSVYIGNYADHEIVGIARKQSFGSEIGTEKSPCMISCILQSDKVKQENYALNFLSCLNKGCDVASSRRSDSGARAKTIDIASERAGKKTRRDWGRGRGKRSLALFPSLPWFFPVFRSLYLYFSLALHYLNAWNRLDVMMMMVMMMFIKLSRCISWSDGKRPSAETDTGKYTQLSFVIGQRRPAYHANVSCRVINTQ